MANQQDPEAEALAKARAKDVFIEKFLKLGNGCRPVRQAIREKYGLKDDFTIKDDPDVFTIKVVVTKQLSDGTREVQDGTSHHVIATVADGLIIDASILQFCFPLTRDEENKYIYTKYGLKEGDVKDRLCSDALDYALKESMSKCPTFDRDNILKNPYYVGRREEHPLYPILKK